jgi:hypothetical protein
VGKRIPVYGGKYLSREAFHNWVEIFPEGRSKAADYARPDAEVAETTGFDTMVKRWDKCISVGGGYVEK